MSVDPSILEAINQTPTATLCPLVSVLITRARILETIDLAKANEILDEARAVVNALHRRIDVVILPSNTTFTTSVLPSELHRRLGE